MSHKQDMNLVSDQDHEMNYILGLYGFSQSEEKREWLRNALEKFKNTEKLKPHNRADFYIYLESTYDECRKEALK